MNDRARIQDTSLLWTLEEISRLISYTGDPSETLTNIVLLIQRRFKTDVCSVYLLETDRSTLVLSATIGLRPESIGSVRMRPNEGLVGLVAEHLRPICVEDATAHPRFKYFPEAGEDPYHSFLGVPLLDRGVLQGVLVVQTVEPRSFDEDETRLLMTAGAQLAPIVSDVRLERRRGLESELVQQAKAELLQTLAGGVAHELNNKLMPVVGFSELLIEEAEQLGSVKFQEYGRSIHESALEAARIIQQLLQLSKPSAAEHVVCDLVDVMRQAINLVRLRLKEASIDLVVELPDAAVLVEADAGQLKQVFVNLVWNAIDAMESATDRRVIVRLEAHAGTATLSCIDHGTGIPQDTLSRIFDPFFTTKEPTRGTGLGLSVCYSIAKLHGGNLRVQSTPGVGSAFHLALPVHAGDRRAASEKQWNLVESNVLNGHRVLLVDDDERIGNVVAQTLQTRLACGVERARNGREAVGAIERGEFALVLCDVRMPSMNGVEFLDWMTRERPDLLERTLFMTGDGGNSILNAAIERSGRPLLLKPFTRDALIDAVLKTRRASDKQLPAQTGH